MRIFKTKNFARWARKEAVFDATLLVAVDEIKAGLVDADLGSGLVKKRVARKGQGKRGGHRVLLAFKKKDRSIFVFGFSKNDRDNLDAEEKEMYKKVAELYLDATMISLEKMCNTGQLIEVYDEKTR